MAGLIAQGTNFFFGVCVILGAAFVFQRSKRGALFVALAGLGYLFAVLIDIVLAETWRTFAFGPSSQFFHFLSGVGRHLVLFGGLAMGMRTIAMETT